MALTISTHPLKNIINDPSFVVSTSLTPGASIQNLRIRAAVYIGGRATVAAQLDQPYQLTEWDFTDMLRSFAGKCNVDAFGAVNVLRPGVSAELLTAWTNYMTGFSTWSTSGRDINSAISSGAPKALSNDLGSCVAGDIFVIGSESGEYGDTGANKFYLRLTNTSISPNYCETKYAGLTGGELTGNHIYFLMAHGTQTAPAVVWMADGPCAGAIKATIHKITDFRDNPGVYFHVSFTEIYEDADNVTTTGATKWTDCMLFIPATVRPGEAFDDFLIDAEGRRFLSRLGEAQNPYMYGQNMEMRVMAVSTGCFIHAYITTDHGTEVTSTVANLGWMMLILNDVSTDVAETDADIVIWISADDYTSEHITFPCDQKFYKVIKALSFIGDLGEETLLFRGLHKETGKVSKSYFRVANRIRRVLRAYKSTNWILRSLYETEGTRRLLHELNYTEQPVWMYDADEPSGYKEVVVLSDDTVITDGNELIDNDIQVEYYE
jgi:hypothetical protein